MGVLIEKDICDKVLLVGVNYKKNLGGMSSVIQYYKPYFENLRYVSTYCYSGKVSRIIYFALALFKIYFFLLFDKKLEIVHIHTAADGSFYRATIIIKICKIFRKKVILHSHASRFKDFYNESNNKTKILNILKTADKLVVLSNSWKEWFQSIGIDKKSIVILNNITDFPQIKEQDNNDNKLHLLFLGLLGKRKGIFDIIKSISDYRADFNNRLIFKIGGNTHEKELLYAIKQYGIEDLVEFEGWVTGKKKINLLNWANAYILPSYNEGLPIGILEAMSYGCAIIASPVGGIPEVVENGYNGFLVEPGNTKDIAKAIFHLLDKQELINMSNNSKTIVKEYLPDKVIEDLLMLYKQLLLKQNK